jgi:hypothetical protein
MECIVEFFMDGAKDSRISRNDFGVYILSTPTDEGREFRVKCFEHEENLNFEPPQFDERFRDAMRVIVYGEARVFRDEIDALIEARSIFWEKVQEGQQPFWGICDHREDTPFPVYLTHEEAIRIRDEQINKLIEYAI